MNQAVTTPGDSLASNLWLWVLLMLQNFAPAVGNLATCNRWEILNMSSRSVDSFFSPSFENADSRSCESINILELTLQQLAEDSYSNYAGAEIDNILSCRFTFITQCLSISAPTRHSEQIPFCLRAPDSIHYPRIRYGSFCPQVISLGTLCLI